MTLRTTALSLMALLLGTVLGCASPPPAPPLEAAAQAARPAPEPYRLLPGDALEVKYRYTPEFNQSATIQADGWMSLEIVGPVKASGLTVDEVHDAIVQKASVRLNKPEVAVSLKEFERPYFVVSGEVQKPGKFDLKEPITALHAIMVAGGFTKNAKVDQVLLFRKANSDVAEVMPLNLIGNTETKTVEENPVLKPGDMLMVTESTFSKVERVVKLLNIGMFLPLP